MRAIPNSLSGSPATKASGTSAPRPLSCLAKWAWQSVVITACCAAVLSLQAIQNTNSLAVVDAAPSRAAQQVDLALIRFQSDSNNVRAGWELARACFDASAAVTNKSARAAYALQGIGICRQVLAFATNAAPVHYYFGMNLGQLADTKRNFAGLQLVYDMEREFNHARDLDEHFDFAGPDRNLGLLYGEAPVLISIGSRSLALQHLERALKLAPDYPENRLNLAEAYSRWNDKLLFQHQMAALEQLWPGARIQFNGERWQFSWVDWERRRGRLRTRLRALEKDRSGY